MDISNASDGEDRHDVDEATDDNLKEEESVEIDFDFYDPKKIDFHSIKNLLNQLFSSDSELFNLSELTELIIEQPLVGSTVKVDGSESDPYAILTVLNMKVHKERQCMKSLVNYLLEKTKKDSRLNDILTNLFKENKHDVGLILSERLINMPVQLIPPMYKMLKEEIQWANESYEFEWYLIISKTYREVASTIDEEMNLEPTIFYFHAEDEIIEQ
ncbi:7894_t:CDS:2, partial [Diversispora eburnea]